mmetsp:Transcript_7303/g.17888  ORF Transcript_7303/g.17888 Transcript_7303/m.17888 type:complete len:1165 (+) Transcript_7303:582-4076(+)
MSNQPPTTMSASAPSSPALMDRSTHLGLREEVLFLRRRVVQLETAQADNERLRKDLARTKMNMQEEKSELELEFMNQMHTVAMDNASQLEEIECRLKESHNVNRKLSDQLAELGGRDGVQRRIDEVEKIHQREIAQVVDRKHEEIEKIEEELRAVRKTRDDVSSRLVETTRQLEMEKRKALETSSRQSVPGPLEESLQAMLETVQEENKRLQEEVHSIEEKMDEKYREDVKAIREKLRSRDSELNTKQGEIRRLESEVKSSKSLKTKIVDLEKESRGLQIEVDNSNKLRREKEAVITRLENELRETNHALRKVENENKELKSAIQRQKDANDFVPPPSRQSLGGSIGIFAPPTVGKRTSEIIMKLEQNLKSEGKKKHKAVVALKSRSENGPCKDDVDKNEQINSLKTEVTELKEKLEMERESTMSLRKELQDLKSAKKDTIIESRIKSQSKQVQGSKAVLPPERSDDSHSRDGVKGIVSGIEKKIWRDQSTIGATESIAIQKLMEHATEYPGLAEDLEEVRDELDLERAQIVELEDELTRQCEINCTLLKEISNLTTEHESSRQSHAQSFGMITTDSDKDRKEIDRLMMEVSRVKSELFNVEQSKSKLEKDLSIMKKEKKEIQVLHEKLAAAENESKRIVKRMEDSVQLDASKIEKLQREVEELQRELDGAEKTIKELRLVETSNQSIANGQIEKMKQDFDQIRQEDQEMIEKYKTKVLDLEAEVTKAKDLQGSPKTKSLQRVESLKSQVEALRASVRNSDQARVALASENQNLSAEIDRLVRGRNEAEKTSEDEHSQLKQLQKMVDQKVDEFEKLHSNDQQLIRRLQDEVTSLEGRLSSSHDELEELTLQLKQRDEVEDQVDVLSRKNVESLHAQINKLQNDMMKKRVELSETEAESTKTISILEETIEKMKTEMDQAIASRDEEIAGLKSSIDEKERKMKQIEVEKEQLVLSMNEMMKCRRDEIEELQTEFMEMSSKAANQARQVQTLKSQLEESSYRKEEMDRLRARVTELSDEVSSRGGSPRSMSLSSRTSDLSVTDLEIENNELRQKLREAVAEKQMAEEKIRDYVEDKGGSSKTVQVLRERNTTLKFEVEKLTRKLQKISDIRRMSSSTEGSRSSRSSRSGSGRSQNSKQYQRQRTLGTAISQSSSGSSTVESIRFVI